MQITEPDLELLVDEPYRSRGARYAREGLVELLQSDDNSARARVHGTHHYRVSLAWEDGALSGDCACPAFEDRGPCKHMAALGYALIASSADDAEKGTTSRKGRRTTLELIAEYLEKQPPEALLNLLVQEAKRNPAFRKRLEMLRKTDQASVDVAGLRKALRQAIGHHRFIDWDRVAAWAEGIGVVVDAIAKLPLPKYAEDVRALAEYGMELMNEALTQVDDSNGESGYPVEALKALHLAACRHTAPDPASFGEFLFHKEWADHFDFYYNATARYADILGERGVAAFRRAAQAAWKALPAASPAPESYKGIFVLDHSVVERMHLRRIVEREFHNDPQALIGMMQKDMANARDYIEMAKRYEQLGETDRAIGTAEEGWKIFSKRMPDVQLQRYLVAAYHRYDMHQKALDLLWKLYDRGPHILWYRELKNSAQLAGVWAEWQQKMMARAEKDIPKGATRASQKGSLIVAIHLANEEPQAAWKAALQWGCYESLWEELADKHAALQREEAIRICQRTAEDQIRITTKAGYNQAVVWIRKAQALHGETSAQRDAFTHWVETLRSAHKAKRNFIQRLSSQGL